MADIELAESDLVKLLRALPSSISLIAIDRRLLFANRLSSGYRQAEVVGRDVIEFLPPAAQEEFATTFSRVLETASPAMYEIPVLDPEGNTLWYGGTLAPIVEQGEVSAVANIARHMVERDPRLAGRKKRRNTVAVCAWCREVRSASNDWQSIEEYLEEKEEGAPVTHSICPTCYGRMEGELEAE